MPLPPEASNIAGLWPWLAEHSETLRDYAIVIASIAGARFAFVRSQAADVQAQIASRDHGSQLFKETAENLDHRSELVRIGAVHLIVSLAQDFPTFEIPVNNLLNAYIVKWSVKKKSDNPPADVKIALAYIIETIGDDAEEMTENGETES